MKCRVTKDALIGWPIVIVKLARDLFISARPLIGPRRLPSKPSITSQTLYEPRSPMSGTSPGSRRDGCLHDAGRATATRHY